MDRLSNGEVNELYTFINPDTKCLKVGLQYKKRCFIVKMLFTGFLVIVIIFYFVLSALQKRYPFINNRVERSCLAVSEYEMCYDNCCVNETQIILDEKLNASDSEYLAQKYEIEIIHRYLIERDTCEAVFGLWNIISSDDLPNKTINLSALNENYMSSLQNVETGSQTINGSAIPVYVNLNVEKLLGSGSTVYKIKIGSQSYSLISSNYPKNHMISPYSGFKYLITPHMVFKKAYMCKSSKIWYLAESLETIYSRPEYTIEETRQILNNTIRDLLLLEKCGYFVDDFDKLDLFVVIDEITGKIVTSKILNNGNFIRSVMNESQKEKYVEKFKLAISKMTNDLTTYRKPNTQKTSPSIVPFDNGNVLIKKTIGSQMTDFYFVVSNRVETKCKTIAELLEHPFITGSALEEKDKYGRRADADKINDIWAIYKVQNLNIVS